MISQAEAMEKGCLTGTVVQQAFNMGYLSVKMAVDKLNGSLLETTVYTGYTLSLIHIYARQSCALLV